MERISSLLRVAGRRVGNRPVCNVLPFSYLEKYREFNEDKVDGLFYGAPVIILVFSHSEVDGALCAATMGRIIEAEKLGYCYIKLAAEPMNTPELRQKYNVPDDMHCVIALAIGYYDAEYFCSVPRKDVPLL